MLKTAVAMAVKTTLRIVIVIETFPILCLAPFPGFKTSCIGADNRHVTMKHSVDFPAGTGIL